MNTVRCNKDKRINYELTTLIRLFSLSPFRFFTKIQVLQNERQAKESRISTMKASLEKSREESTSLKHQLGKKFSMDIT